MEPLDEVTIYHTTRKCGFPVGGDNCGRIVGHTGKCQRPALVESTEAAMARAQAFEPSTVNIEAPLTARELLRHHDIDSACLAKWTEGRRRYGVTWHGEPPLLEAYAELVDLLNYYAEHLRTNPQDGPVVSMRAMAKALAADHRRYIAGGRIP